jgi:hypothetical protein
VLVHRDAEAWEWQRRRKVVSCLVFIVHSFSSISALPCCVALRLSGRSDVCECFREGRSAHRVAVGKSEGKRLLEERTRKLAFGNGICEAFVTIFLLETLVYGRLERPVLLAC